MSEYAPCPVISAAAPARAVPGALRPVPGIVAGALLAVSDTPLDADELTGGEATVFAGLPGGPRRRMWLTARRALRQALSACGLPTDTSGCGLANPVASISHCADLAVAAVAVPRPVAVVGVGVDIEIDRTLQPRTAPFFLTETERFWLATAPETDRSQELLRLWTVKEALFKADPSNNETVLREYCVASPPDYRGCAARICSARSESPEFWYVSFALPRGFLSVAMALMSSWREEQMQVVDFDQVARQISSLVSVPVVGLTPQTTIAELVPDSFRFIEVVVDLQEEYDVVLSQDDLKSLHTLGDLATLLQRRQAASPGT